MQFPSICLLGHDGPFISVCMSRERIPNTHVIFTILMSPLLCRSFIGSILDKA